jgi:hypothetical protein
MESNNIIVIENFLTNDECDSALNKCKNIVLKDVDIRNNAFNRKVSVGFVHDLEFIKIRLQDVLKNSININGMEMSVDYFQFTEYKVGDYFDWHEDRSSNLYRIGVFSTVIQLNDNYDGGILEIKNLKNELVPIENKKGSLYIFNPNLLHRITKIESGSRHSLISWVSLIKTNKTKQNLI